MSNCLVAQSGGPTSVINASLSGVVEECFNHPDIKKVYGSLNGINGILNHNLVDLYKLLDGSKENVDQLKTTPAMFLGSCRFKLEDSSIDDHQYKKIFDAFQDYDIKYFFYIGGNDSMDTVDKLSQYAEKHAIDVHIIGIPKTIDNDLFGTDHTPGFGSAAKFIATTILEIAHDTYIYDIKSVTIIEIMGRNAGWLTAAAALARNDYNVSPDLIYLPEIPFSKHAFINDIKKCQKQKNNVIIAISEGVKDIEGNYISATSASNDAFGHSQLSGTAKVLECFVKEELGCKVRSIELNVLQRSATHIASKTDVEEANLIGKSAVEYAYAGKTGIMMTLTRSDAFSYRSDVCSIPVCDVANKEKVIPREWINIEGNDVTDELINYMRPLIIGEVAIPYKNGIPDYLDITHLTE